MSQSAARERCSGILTAAAAHRIGIPSIANQKVQFDKDTTDGVVVARNIYFNGECIANSVSLDEDGIIED